MEKVHMSRKARHKNKAATELPSVWIAMGAMGSLVAYSASAGPAVRPAHAGQTRATPSVNVLVQNATTYRFDIGEESLANTVAAFQKITGLKVALAREGLGSLSSPGIRGETTAERALQQILEGTGVTYRYTAADTVTLDLQPLSTSVDVSTAAPGTVVSSSRYIASLREIPQSPGLLRDDIGSCRPSSKAPCRRSEQTVRP